MKLLFYCLYAMQPALLLLGMLGLFGEEGKEAAEELAKGITVIVGILLLATAMFYGIYLLTGWLPV